LELSISTENAVFSLRPMARFRPLISGSSLAGCQILKPPEVRDDPVADLSLLVAVALDELQILAAAGSRDLRVHVATLRASARCINTSYA
jgi:hypothetical protein